jgi:hypothetical protein
VGSHFSRKAMGKVSPLTIHSIGIYDVETNAIKG